MLTFQELDQYPKRSAGDRKRLAFCGPLSSSSANNIAPPWPAAAGTDPVKRIFAYLKRDYAHLGATLLALAACGQPVVVFGLGSGSAVTDARNIAFSQRPVDVPTAARECAIDICHAGNTTAALLQSGCPLLLLPTQLEQFMVGARAAELGAAIVINPEEKNPDIAGALARLLSDAKFADRAAAFSARYSEWSPDRILANVVGRLTSAALGELTTVASGKVTTVASGEGTGTARQVKK